MPDYLVTWEIEQWATDPYEAAAKAWQCRSASGSLANTFIVTNPATGVTREVDLAAGDPDPSGNTPSQTFLAGFQIAVAVDAATPAKARRLLDSVDFDVRPIGGPVRLGLVRALGHHPVALTLRSIRDGALTYGQAGATSDGVAA